MSLYKVPRNSTSKDICLNIKYKRNSTNSMTIRLTQGTSAILAVKTFVLTLGSKCILSLKTFVQCITVITDVDGIK